jgi:phosphatidylglycerol:prolipoprotein diacylglycerol transferase
MKPGDVSLGYLVWYPLGRFFLEFFRTDSWFFGGTPFNLVHILCAGAVGLAIATLYRRHARA